MSELNEFLYKNERLIYETGPHWVIFIMPAVFSLAVIGTLFIPISNYYITLAVMLFAAYSWVSAMIAQRFTAYGVTSQRVLTKTGLFSRQTSGVLIKRIESVDVVQPIWGRVVGCGSVLVTGTGGGVDVFYNIAEPFEFRKHLVEQLHESD